MSRSGAAAPPTPPSGAGLLSHDTAERIYLLLRTALATHLTQRHGSCPLLLDDVTVHAYSGRARNVLELPQRASTDRQVVRSTQEEQVPAWASERLTGPQHRIIRLADLTFC